MQKFRRGAAFCFEKAGYTKELCLPQTGVVWAERDVACLLEERLVSASRTLDLGINASRTDLRRYGFDIHLIDGAFPVHIGSEDRQKNFPVVQKGLFSEDSIFSSLKEELTEFFLEHAQPFCPKCHKTVQQDELFKKLDKYQSGVFVLSFKVDAPLLKKLNLDEICEMYGLNFLIMGDKIVRPDEVSSMSDISGVLATYNVTEKDELIGCLKEKLKSGFSELQLYHFPSRREAGEFTCTFYDDPVCLSCGYRFTGLQSDDMSFNEDWRYYGRSPREISNLSVKEAGVWQGLPFEIQQELSILSELGLGEKLLSSSLNHLSHGEWLKCLLWNLLKLDLHDCVLFFDSFLQVFSRDEAQQCLKFIRILAQNNACILFAGKEREVGDYELAFNGEDLKLEMVSSQFKLPAPKKLKSYKLNADNFQKYVRGPVLAAVSGGSGSGKTTFLRKLAAAPQKYLNFNVICKTPENIEVTGENLAVMTGLAEKIADIYASTLASRMAGLTKRDFFQYCRNYNIAGCQFENDGILEVKVNDFNLSDIMGMTINEAGKALNNVGMERFFQNLSDLAFGDYYLGTSRKYLSSVVIAKTALLLTVLKGRSRKTVNLIIVDDILADLTFQSEVCSFLKELVKEGAIVVICSNDEEALACADVVFAT